MIAYTWKNRKLPVKLQPRVAALNEKKKEKRVVQIYFILEPQSTGQVKPLQPKNIAKKETIKN